LILGYLLLILVPIGAIAYLVWDHKRKTAARNAAAEGRLQELLAVAQPQPAAKPAERAAAPASQAGPAEATAGAVSAVSPTAPAPLYTSRERVLSAPQTLAYYLLRTGLPDHVVLARVSLASVVEAGPGLSGFAREEQIRRLAALTVDFVVAEKTMRPVAVVELASGDEGGAAQSDRASARTRLAAAGVRYLELDPKQLPRKEAMRTLVLGEAAQEMARSEAGVTG